MRMGGFTCDWECAYLEFLSSLFRKITQDTKSIADIRGTSGVPEIVDPRK